MGVRSVRVAKIIIGLVWLFIILMVIIGNALHSDKSELYQSPTPVSALSVLVANHKNNLSFRFPVLVLDRFRLSSIQDMG